MNRNNLRPIFKRLPLYVLRLLGIASLPIHLIVGAVLGIREGAKDWLLDMRSITRTVEDLFRE